jgi:thiamine biosynthesis protein ThiI
MALIIVRHGEIYTKSEYVRQLFIQTLYSRLQNALPGATVRSAKWRLYVEGGPDDAMERISRVFGVVSFSPAIEIPPTIEKMREVGLSLVKARLNKRTAFAVRTHRLDKNFPVKSPDVSREVGGYIQDATGAPVDLDNPKVCLNIEIFSGKAHLFTETYPGPGGLPLGTAGRMLALIDGKNSVLAAWMMMKRGLIVTPEFADKKAEKLFSVLEKWGYSQHRKSAELGVITGETDPRKFAQLWASFNVPVYAPLIGLDKKQLAALEKKVFK